MKAPLALWLSLPFLVCACSDDDPPAMAAAGTGGTAGASGGAGSAGTGGAGGAAGAGGSAGANGGASGASMSGAGGGMPGGGAGNAGAPAADAGADAGEPADVLSDETMTFFVTSEGIGNGGDLGGLAGADAFCRQLATAASPTFARRTWRAYLSTATVNAGERIGTGPWHNQAGVIIANDLTQLHDQGEDGSLNDTWPIGVQALPLVLDEQGNQVANGVHDILTGTQADGTLDEGLTCSDWTSSSAEDDVRVGHSNRDGGGQDPSWTTTHTVGCNQTGPGNITSGGGRGSLYCFAVIIER